MNEKFFENDIYNISVYLHRMQKSVLDKMFFMDKIFEPIDSIVDFGCANAELIKAIHALFGEYNFIGYDLNPSMIDEAKKNAPFARFYSDWDKIEVDPDKSILNLSSVIHEVYTYGTKEDVKVFWHRVFDSNFKYITIRDMMLSQENNVEISKEDDALLRNHQEYSKRLEDYENFWGEIKNTNDFVHFLLKYKYTQNWDRELRENYIPISLEEFRKLIPDEYEVIMFEHYTLPYTKWQIKNDFGITLNTPTHVKFILRKR